jgi:hypothetical protein
MAQNQKSFLNIDVPRPIDPVEQARHIFEAKTHLDRIYFSDVFVGLLREGLDDGTGLAQYTSSVEVFMFDDEKWRSLFQSALRGEFELQEPGEGLCESAASDKEVFHPCSPEGLG